MNILCSGRALCRPTTNVHQLFVMNIPCMSEPIIGLLVVCEAGTRHGHYNCWRFFVNE